MANFLSGIYVIKCIANNSNYVGSTINFKQRFKDHKCRLKSNIHYNNRLQKCWNKYGSENFIFEVLEYIDSDVENLSDVLCDREIYYIQNTENTLNLCIVTKRNKLAYTRTEEHRKQIGERSYIGRKACVEARKGSKHSLESKIKMTRAKCGNRKVGLYSLEGELEQIFENTSEAVLITGYKSSNIRNNLYKITNTCKGKIFKFINE